MKKRVQLPAVLPEVLLGVLAGYLFLRELGTFPAPWIDDGLYMTVARSVAQGVGFSLPLLENVWHMPTILHVGPPLIWPVALSIAVFDFSIEASRLPMVLYLAGTAAALYWYARQVSNRCYALWSTALLVTLSAFVNTGKPVLGEVPAVCLALLSILAWRKLPQSPWYMWLAGLLLAGSVLAKLTFAVLLPALALAWFFTESGSAMRRRTVGVLGIAVAVVAAWKAWEYAANDGSLLEGYVNRLRGDSPGVPRLLTTNPAGFLRLPFFVLFGMYAVGLLGIWRSRISTAERVFVTAGMTLFLFYFLNGPGWYRHGLPAHVLALPFVPLGMRVVLGRYLFHVVLGLGVAVQLWWQLDHRGSSHNPALPQVVSYLETHEELRPVIIRQAEVYVHFVGDNGVYFLPHDALAAKIPNRLTRIPKTLQCATRVMKGERESGVLLEKFGAYGVYEVCEGDGTPETRGTKGT